MNVTPIQTEKRTVVFIDDDVIVLQSLERGLMDESYNKYFVSNCKEALEIVHREEVQVLVTDMCMPEMSGLELLRQVRKERPNIICIALSGYEKDEEVKKAVDQGEIFRLINKPWKLGSESFEKIIRLALEQYDLNTNPNPEKGKLEQYKTKFKKWIKLGSNK
ncbi:MAG: response regulator [Sedimentisphaerales bacterium]|nr:response regulator [Sedimentisphaerales bacterium]